MKKKGCSILLVLAMVLSVFMIQPVQVQAAPEMMPGLPVWIRSRNWQTEHYIHETEYLPLEMIKKNARVTVKSSRPGVVSVSYNKKGKELVISIKKPGKTIISVTVKQDGKTYRTKKLYTIWQYKNIIKSFKIGNKEYAASFNEYPWANYESKNKKQTINVKVKSGNKLVCIYGEDKKEETREFKNGSKIKLSAWESINVIVEDTKGDEKGILKVYTLFKNK